MSFKKQRASVNFVTDKKEASVRLGVGLMIVNRHKNVFVAQRVDFPYTVSAGASVPVWQMPQGGIDEGESPGDACYREMEEEIGSRQGRTLGESQNWYTYKLPFDIHIKEKGKEFHSQRQKWFLIEFLGNDTSINIQTQCPEFMSWKWAEFGNLIDFVVPFKKELYQEVMQEFSWYFI